MSANINLAGTLNEAALTVPGAYVNVLAPPPGPIPGAPSNIVGAVGTASWGPVGVPVTVGGLTSAAQAFGAPNARRYDLVTAIWAASLQGTNSFRAVRVTDGTDVAATVTVQTTGGTLTAKYTGSVGNGLLMTIGAGTKASTQKVTLSLPGLVPEVYDNIAGTANAAWVNIAAAINSGSGVTRGASQIAVFSAGASTTTPTSGSVTATGGTDGATTITSSVLIGQDALPRKGMYGLRGQGCAVAFLADCADATTWSTQAAFALSEQLQMADCTVSGDTVSGFATTVSTAGTDSPWFKAILGDWCYLNDTINGVVRLIAPTGVYAGLKAYIGPQNSVLNKPILGIVGTQSSAANKQYAFADLQALVAARGDVIANPSPGGSYFGFQTGQNSSSNSVENDDSYCTLTNFLALSLSGPQGGGQFVGQLATPTEQRQAQSAIAGLLQVMADAAPPLIGSSSGALPYSVTISTSANGVQTATVAVVYLSVIRFFVVNLTAGATVQIAANANQAQQFAQAA